MRLPNVVFELLCLLDSPIQMMVVDRFVLVPCKLSPTSFVNLITRNDAGEGLRRRNNIADLTSIEIRMGKSLEVLFNVSNVYCLLEIFQSCDEVLPDRQSLRLRQVIVVDGQLNSGFEGFVECSELSSPSAWTADKVC